MPVDPALLTAFVVTVVLVCIVPGPDMLFVLATALRHGPRGGVAAAAGMAGGMAVHTAAAVVGISALVASSTTAFTVLRYAGVAYLLWLAVGALRHGDGDAPASRPPAASLRRVFRQAAVTNLLNPKIVVFYLAFLPQFTDPARGSLGVQLLVLGGVFLTVGFVIDALVGLAAGGAGRRLATSVRVRRALDRVAAVMYLGLAGRLATER